MDGYAIVVLNDESGKTAQYWNGTDIIDDASSTYFFTNKIDARRTLGSLQSTFSDSDLKIVSAKMSIVLGE